MPKKNTQESFLNQPFSTITWIIMIAVLLVVAYVIGYSMGVGEVSNENSSNNTTASQMEVNNTNNKVSTTDDLTVHQNYENVNFGFTLEYPTDWTAEDAIQTVGSSSDNQALTLTGTDGTIVNLHVNGSNLTESQPEATYTINYKNGKIVLGDKLSASQDSDPTTGTIQFEGSINGNTYLFTATGVTDQASEDAVKTIVSNLKLTAK